MKFVNSESYKKGIVASVALNILAKCLAFINSMAIAFYFGTKTKTDIYFYCYATVGLVVSYIGSLDNSVIIPEGMRIREQEGAEKAKSFLNYFLYLYSFIGLLTTVLFLINPVGILKSISQFDVHALESNRNLIFWFIPICVLMLITQYLTNLLCSYKYFTAPIIAGIINNFFSLTFLFAFHNSLDVKSIIVGLCSGYLVNICLLVFLMKQQLKWNFRYHKVSFHANLWKNIRYALFGNVASFFSGYAPFYIMSNFNPGIVTMFNYSKNLSEIPNQIVTTQFSSVSAIKFNELCARKDYKTLNDLFIQSTQFLTFLMIPVCGVLFLFSNEIVAFFYERGAFGAQSVRQTAFMLKFLSFSVVFFAVNTMVSRLFMATQKLKEPIRFQVSMNILFIVIVALASYKFGITGFVAGTVIYQAIAIVFTYTVMNKYFPFIKYEKILKGILLNILMNASLVILFHMFLGNQKTNIFFVGFCAAVYLLVIVIANQVFRIDQISRQYGLLAISKFRTNLSEMSKQNLRV